MEGRDAFSLPSSIPFQALLLLAEQSTVSNLVIEDPLHGIPTT